jgi:hypothetical protein
LLAGLAGELLCIESRWLAIMASLCVFLLSAHLDAADANRAQFITADSPKQDFLSACRGIESPTIRRVLSRRWTATVTWAVASRMELQKIDLVLVDLKAWDPERHRRLTGMDVDPVLNLARRLASRRKPVWVRYVLVAGLTDNPDEIAQIASFTANLGNVERVDVLPFHQLGAFKWKQLSIEYQLRDAEPPSKEIVESVCAQFRAAGLKAY